MSAMTRPDGYCARCGVTEVDINGLFINCTCGNRERNWDGEHGYLCNLWLQHRLATLAANLRVAAGLCEAYLLGAWTPEPYREQWRPGCGWRAP